MVTHEGRTGGKAWNRDHEPAGTTTSRDAWALRALIPATPAELADTSLEGCRRIEALLARALRSERRRGRAGHWSYDLVRHLALARALRDEQDRLDRHPHGIRPARPRSPEFRRRATHPRESARPGGTHA